ncbi:MAG: PTS sugar transporter subunit IIB [Longicatena sp.]|jgi:D-glucosaminate PTS system EIIB component|uniref:PTS system mannose/fructose/N-acetylgalactosamine-transporter subunit IIB n=1 Tax=Anaerorhabdus sp. TaxID=1872524 RepID=UPI002FCC765A
MSIKMIRLDDRLIHGQIVAAWAKNLQITRIWIVDDGVAKDEFIKGVMRMVAPPDTELEITGTQDIERLVKEFDESSKNTLILVKFPYVAKQIFEANLKIKDFNVGGMGANPERKKLFKNISASAAEVNTLKEIRDMGVRVYFQVTPNEKQTPLSL